MSAWIARWWRPALGIMWLAGLGALTLGSGETDPDQISEMPRVCLICGTRGTADAILNVALFAPLGLLFGGGRRALPSAVGLGLAASLGIEIVQTLLPGRHPSFGDLLWNSVGAGLGTMVRSGVEERVHGRARSGAAAWGGVLLVGFLGAGALTVPHPTDDDYWGQRTPDLGWMPQYDGRVLSAELGERPLLSGRIDHAGPHRELLEGDWELAGRIVVGSDPRAVSPILSIYDGAQREILLLGAHRDDLVFREGTVGDRLRFDRPDVRVPGAFAPFSPGDTIRIAAERSRGTTCLRSGSLERCGVGVTPGRTWGLLLYVEGPREVFRAVVDVLWLAALFFPVGFLGGSAGDLVRGAGAGLAGLALAVVLTPLIAPPWYQVLACLVGVALGRVGLHALRSVAERTAQAGAVSSMASSV